MYKKALVVAIIWFVRLVDWMILIRVFSTWFQFDSIIYKRFIDLIFALTDPIILPIRKMLFRSPMMSGLMFDFSAIVAYSLIHMIARILIGFIQ